MCQMQIFNFMRMTLFFTLQYQALCQLQEAFDTVQHTINELILNPDNQNLWCLQTQRKSH